MAKVTVFNSITLDMDEVMGRVAAQGMERPGSLLFGRRTYEDFFFWPHQTDNPFTEVLDRTRKYIATYRPEGASR